MSGNDLNRFKEIMKAKGQPANPAAAGTNQGTPAPTGGKSGADMAAWMAKMKSGQSGSKPGVVGGPSPGLAPATSNPGSGSGGAKPKFDQFKAAMMSNAQSAPTQGTPTQRRGATPSGSHVSVAPSGASTVSVGMANVPGSIVAIANKGPPRPSGTGTASPATQAGKGKGKSSTTSRKRSAKSADGGSRPAKKARTDGGGKGGGGKKKDGDGRQSLKQMNDVTAVAGVNIDDEQLLEFEDDKGSLQYDDQEEKMFVEPAAVRRRVMKTAVRHGITDISDATTKFVSVMVEERLRQCLANLIDISKHRTDLARDSNLPFETSSDSRKLLRLIEKIERDAITAKETAERDALIAQAKKKESTLRREKADKDGKISKLKQVRQEELEKQKQNVTNAALAKAVGTRNLKSMFKGVAGGDTTSAAASTPGTPGMVPSPAPGTPVPMTTAPTAQSGDGAAGMVTKFKTREEERTISLEDAIAFLETEPQSAKSSLLYKCYLRRGLEAVTGGDKVL